MNVPEALEYLRTDKRSLFRSAHQWAFGHVPDLSRDIIEFSVSGITPAYVSSYIETVIVGGQHALQTVSREH